jgi:hypothetical protein
MNKIMDVIKERIVFAEREKKSSNTEEMAYFWDGQLRCAQFLMNEAAAELDACRRLLTEARGILQRIEFVDTDLFPECPVCRFQKPSHAEDCELDAALKGEA